MHQAGFPETVAGARHGADARAGRPALEHGARAGALLRRRQGRAQGGGPRRRDGAAADRPGQDAAPSPCCRKGRTPTRSCARRAVGGGGGPARGAAARRLLWTRADRRPRRSTRRSTAPRWSAPRERAGDDPRRGAAPALPSRLRGAAEGPVRRRRTPNGAARTPPAGGRAPAAAADSRAARRLPLLARARQRQPGAERRVSPSTATLPAREALILSLLLAQPSLIADHAEESGRPRFRRARGRPAARCHARPRPRRPAAEQQPARRPRPRGVRRHAGQARQVRASLRMVLAARCRRADAEAVLRQALTLHHKARALHRELVSAEAALANDASEANLARMRDIQEQISALAGWKRRLRVRRLFRASEAGTLRKPRGFTGSGWRPRSRRLARPGSCTDDRARPDTGRHGTAGGIFRSWRLAMR